MKIAFAIFIAGFVLSLSMAAQAGSPTCHDVFARGTVSEQLISLQDLIAEKQARGELDIARVLYRNFRALYAQAIRDGVTFTPIKIQVDVTSKIHDEKQARAELIKREARNMLNWVPLHTLPSRDQIFNIHVAPTGDQILYQASWHEIRLHDFKTGEDHTIASDADVDYRSIQPDWSSGTILVRAEGFETLAQVLSIAEGKVLWQSPTENLLEGYDGTHAYLMNGKTVRVVDWKTNATSRTIHLPTEMNIGTKPQLVPDTNLMVTKLGENLFLFNNETREAREIDSGTGLYEVGKKLIAYITATGRVRVLKLSDLSEVFISEEVGSDAGFQLGRDESSLCVRKFGKSPSCFDLATGKLITTFEHEGYVALVHLSRDADRLVIKTATTLLIYGAPHAEASK